MRAGRLILSLALILSCGLELAAQAPAPADAKFPEQTLCSFGNILVSRRALDGGFSLQVQRPLLSSRNGEKTEDARGCEVILQNPSGDTVYRYADGEIWLNGATGQDVTGDGIPDLVLKSMSDGTGHYEATMIVSLEAHARPLWGTSLFGGAQGELPDFPRDRLIATESGMSFLRNARDGRVILIGSNDAYDRSGFEISVAVPFELVAGRALDSSSDVGNYEGAIAEFRSALTPDQLSRFQNSNPGWDDCPDKSYSAPCPPTPEPRDDAYRKTERAILGISINYLYSGRPDLAWSTLDEMWPASDRARTRADILDNFCHYGLRKQLKLQLVPDCATLKN